MKLFHTKVDTPAPYIPQVFFHKSPYGHIPGYTIVFVSSKGDPGGIPISSIPSLGILLSALVNYTLSIKALGIGAKMTHSSHIVIIQPSQLELGAS